MLSLVLSAPAVKVQMWLAPSWHQFDTYSMAISVNEDDSAAHAQSIVCSNTITVIATWMPTYASPMHSHTLFCYMEGE